MPDLEWQLERQQDGMGAQLSQMICLSRDLLAVLAYVREQLEDVREEIEEVNCS